MGSLKNPLSRLFFGTSILIPSPSSNCGHENPQRIAILGDPRFPLFRESCFDMFFQFLVSPAGNFSKKVHGRHLESTLESVLWDFHTNFFPRIQPWPREPPKDSHFLRSKVFTFPRVFASHFCFFRGEEEFAVALRMHTRGPRPHRCEALREWGG